LEDGVYSLEQRKRAVELYIKYGLKATATIRELGYPSRAQLVSWHREWQENGGRLTDRSLEQYTLEQKRAAVRHYLTHGRCNAFTRRELGYPKCTAKLAEWIDEYAPGERRATQPRVFDASEKAAAVKALASRASSAQEVADLVGCTRSALYKWKRELLREEPPMSEDRPSKPARTRGRSPATQADIAALEARKAELEAELEEPGLRRDIMEGALEVLGKGAGADPANEPANREKTLLIGSLRPKWRLCELLSALGMARSSYQYQQGALRAPDRDEEARRRISEVFDANDGIYGRRRIHDELKAGGRDHRGAQDRPHHGRGGARGPGQDEAKAALQLLRGRGHGTSGQQGQAGLCGGASQLPVAHGRDAVLGPAGKLYLSPVLDCFDGSIVSWTTSTSPNAEMANSMLEAAIRLTKPGERAHLIVHSDCGCHYRWPGWISICEEAGIIRSMSRKGSSPDNSRMEGFFGTMKNEMFYGRDWESVSLEELGKRIDDYIEWHDTKRIRRSLGSMSPLAYRQSLTLAA
jgi:transposase InsO family protein/transposase-like protein